MVSQHDSAELQRAIERLQFALHAEGRTRDSMTLEALMILRALSRKGQWQKLVDSGGRRGRAD